METMKGPTFMNLKKYLCNFSMSIHWRNCKRHLGIFALLLVSIVFSEKVAIGKTILLPEEAAGFIADAAPEKLANAILPGTPVSVRFKGQLLTFKKTEPGVLENRTGDLITRITFKREESYNALWYRLSFTNQGDTPIGDLKIVPFALRIDVDPPRTIPRVRYMTGSQHYDATYPSRAFELVDRAIMIPDHAKPIEIGGQHSKDYVQMMQFALQRGEDMAGFWVSFEWSAAWSMKAGYSQAQGYLIKLNLRSKGVPDADFVMTGEMAFGGFMVPPHTTVQAPKVHMVFFEGQDWTPLENNGRRYIREAIAYKQPPKSQVNKVTYDHWFGIHSGFDKEDMILQAKRAAELGCEYFCLDAGWYGKGAFGASGKGVWDEPDPVKFPGGIADVQELSKLCQKQGMGFGLWAYLIPKNLSGEPAFDLSRAEGVDGAVNALRQWIETYDLTWFRYEMAGMGGLNYQRGWDKVMARITKERPDFHIECCLGGGMRFDLGNMRYCTSTWLSDHTADPDVCRATQTGALRFWPGYMLNSAVRAHRNSGDSEATAYNVISRMPGTLSFNGDIAQWSSEATQHIRTLVDQYKQIRHLQSQPVFFPLPQIRTMEAWDVVCFGDGTGEAQLMYVFRVAGLEKQFVKLPDGPGNWSLVMSSDASNVKIEPSGDGVMLTMPPRTASVWIRR